jgi:hypothetical protein
MLTDENGNGYRLNGTALADDAHFASGDEENQNQRLMRESDYYTLMAIQIQAYKCWIAVLAASGHYGWRDFKNEAGARAWRIGWIPARKMWLSGTPLLTKPCG